MVYGSKTKKPKSKTVIMVAVGKLKTKKNGTKRNGKKKKLS